MSQLTRSAIHFEVTATDPGCPARCGRLTTPHGVVETPVFMPVGTQATVKGLWPQQVAECGARIILGNTYHLALRPGAETIAALGGLHRFMGWDGAILTDSGGFQVFSLAQRVRISNQGVTFQSHIDGATLVLTPERAVEIQEQLGADIAMCLDECPPATAQRDELVAAVERTSAWAQRCLAARRRSDQALFGIVQGGTDPELRARSLRQLVELDFPGYALGGLSVGEGNEATYRVLEFTAPLLPADRPRYLMGVGRPQDIVIAVSHGVDMFDCVMPTRNGRNAMAFTFAGPVRLRNAEHARSDLPLEADCDCGTCRRFSRAYLRHLFQAEEMLGPMLVSLHNVRFFLRLMEQIRSAISAGTFPQYVSDTLARLGP